MGLAHDFRLKSHWLLSPRCKNINSTSLMTLWMFCLFMDQMGFPSWLRGKEFTCNAEVTGDLASVSRLGRSPGRGQWNSLQYSYWRIPWTEESGGPRSRQLQRVRYNWSDWARMHGSDKIFSLAEHLKSCTQKHKNIILNLKLQ